MLNIKKKGLFFGALFLSVIKYPNFVIIYPQKLGDYNERDN